MRSWRPFCCGLPGLMRSMAMPSLQPQDRKPGEIVEAVGGGEGQAVVASDGGGQAAFPEQADEGLDDRALPCVDSRASQASRIARGLVGHRQGVTVAAVAEPELALEVGAPQIVGLRRLRQRRALGLEAPPLAGALDQAMAVEHGMHRAPGRNAHIAGQLARPAARGSSWRPSAACPS